MAEVKFTAFFIEDLGEISYADDEFVFDKLPTDGLPLFSLDALRQLGEDVDGLALHDLLVKRAVA